MGQHLLNTIIVGDALTVLQRFPDDFFDVIVTSPPYNKGEKGGWLVGKVVYENIRDNRPENEYQDEQVRVLDALYRVTKPGGSLFYNHKVRYVAGVAIHPYQWISRSQWRLRQEIIWYRKVAGNLRGWRFWCVDERVYWLYKPRFENDIGQEMASRHALLTSVWTILPEKDSRHPAPFPIELPTRCIYSVLDGNYGVVLDPYCGIGTTLVAAKLLGCDFVGIEICEDYVKIAEERIRQAEKERPRVEKEMELHVVRKPYRERKARGEWLGPHGPQKEKRLKTN